jgi:hypothetical protein
MMQQGQAGETGRSNWQRAAARAAGVLALSAMLWAIACGGGSSNADAQLVRLADRATAEFNARGDGLFIDTTVIIYCRLNVPYDDPVFKQLDFEPTGSAMKDYEFCYNVNDDRTRVALTMRSAKDGSTRCIILSAPSGSVVRGEIHDDDRCAP